MQKLRIQLPIVCVHIIPEQEYHLTNKFLGRFSIVIWLVLISVLSFGKIHAQNTTGIPGQTQLLRLEIEQLEFSGNTTFTDDILLTVISSRPSELSLSRNILRYLADNIGRNSYTPRNIRTNLQIIQSGISDELRYFNRETAASDSLALVTFYNEHGFHQTRVRYSFGYESSIGRNVLRFEIREGTFSRIDTIVYRGLDSLPAELQEPITRAQSYIKRGDRFDQLAVSRQNDNILQVLRNNGYYYAEYSQPVVSLLTQQVQRGKSLRDSVLADSITVRFTLGKRMKIGDISFIDSTGSQRTIVENMRREQLEFVAGSWFNQGAIDRSRANLYALGTYDIVGIDTLRSYDSLLDIQVFTKMRRMEDLSASALTNRNAIDNTWNIGLEGAYAHKNIGGAAQNFNLFTRALLQDINNAIDTKFQNPQYELIIGAKYAQPVSYFLKPLLGGLYDGRIGLNFQAQYSYRFLFYDMKLQSITMRVSFPIPLPLNWDVNSIAFFWNLEQQKPINYQSALNKALQDATDDVPIYQQFIPYKRLNELRGRAISSSVYGLSLVGDKRNNPFSPNAGHLATFSMEYAGLLGAANYIRMESMISWYRAWGTQTVFATKLRAGHIFTFGQDTTELYIPIDRYFFAGGSNSVRAFSSRELRVSSFDVASASGETRAQRDLIGSLSLFEASAEIRYKFRSAPRNTGFWEQQFARMGLTFFGDMGSAFNDPLFFKPITSLMSFVENIGVGVGIGFRYDTPVGPFRVDFATKVYNPMETSKWIVERPFAIQWQIGIGHAF